MGVAGLWAGHNLETCSWPACGECMPQLTLLQGQGCVFQLSSGSLSPECVPSSVKSIIGIESFPLTVLHNTILHVNLSSSALCVTPSDSCLFQFTNSHLALKGSSGVPYLTRGRGLPVTLVLPLSHHCVSLTTALKLMWISESPCCTSIF